VRAIQRKHEPKRSANPEIEAMVVERMKHAFEYAAPYNVQMCVENIEVTCMAPLADFVRGACQPNVGITL